MPCGSTHPLENSLGRRLQVAALCRGVASVAALATLAQAGAVQLRLDGRIGNEQEKEKLLQILAEKQDGRLGELSEKELQERIAALD